MKLVSIIPLIKLPRNLGFFDYAVPEKMLVKQYQIVKIPWRKQNINGLIISKPNKTTKSVYKLKNIIEVITEYSIATDKQTELITELAKQYLTSQSLWWKQIIPSIQKRKTKFKPWHQFYSTSANNQIKIKEKLNSNIYQLYINNSVADIYRVIINNLEVKKIQLILCPDLKTIKIILDKLPIEFQKNVAIFHKDLAKSEYTKNYNNVLNNQINIIIGTRIAILLPFTKLDKIFICKSDDYSFKSTDQNPRYWVLDTIPWLQKIYNSQIFYLSVCPRVETLAFFKKNKFSVSDSQNKINTQIIDLNQEINNKNFSSLSLPLEQALAEQLSKGNKSILFLNRKNFSKLIVCSDCQWFPVCPRCQRNLTVINLSTLYCSLCKKNLPTPLSCPRCQGSKIIYKGLTNQSFTQVLKKKFINSHISFLDSINTDSPSETQIFVTTKFFLPQITNKHNLIAFIQIDSELINKDFRSLERAYSFIANAFRGNPKAQHIIQTYHPEHPLFTNLSSLFYESFWKYDMKWRQALAYPPFVKYIKLIIKEKSKIESEKQTNQLLNQLKKTINKSIQIKNPYFLFKDKYYTGNIILCYKNIDPRPYLSKLSTEVIIDFDPEEV